MCVSSQWSLPYFARGKTRRSHFHTCATEANINEGRVSGRRAERETNVDHTAIIVIVSYRGMLRHFMCLPTMYILIQYRANSTRVPVVRNK